MDDTIRIYQLRFQLYLVTFSTMNFIEINYVSLPTTLSQTHLSPFKEHV
jgi:hypothetical protein